MSKESIYFCETDKSREQLISELGEARRRLAETGRELRHLKSMESLQGEYAASKRQYVLQCGINRIFEMVVTSAGEAAFKAACLKVAEDVTESSLSLICEVDAEGRLHHVAMSTSAREACALIEEQASVSDCTKFHTLGIYKRVIKNGVSLLSNEPTLHPDSFRLPEGHPPLTAFLIVPIKQEGMTVGMVVVANRDGGYGSEEQENLETLVPVIKEAMARRRAEAALRESEERYRDLVQSANSVIMRWRNDGMITFFNDYAQALFGYNTNEIVGKHVNLLFPRRESTGTELSGMVQTIVKHPKRYTNTINENVCRDGRRLWISWTNKAVLDKKGDVCEILSIGNDITSLKETEAALRKNSEFPDENPNPVLRIAVDGEVLYGNLPARQWLATFNWQSGKLLPQAVRESVDNARRQNHAITSEIINPAGRTFGFSAIQPPNKEYIYLYGMDLTDRKETEDALRKSEERLKESLTEKEVLLKEIHHRVKNNMQVISSLVDLQADELEDDNSAMRSILQDVTHRVRSMAMVHEKLYQSTDLARVDFADYAESLLGYLWRAHGPAVTGLLLKLDLEPVLLPVNMAVPCGLILNELFSNSLKHAFGNQDSGEVTVSFHENTDGRVNLSVKDNGIGLPKGFDWKQANSLGLRLVQMLAGQLHAAVEVSSGAGTQFAILFKRPKI